MKKAGYMHCSCRDCFEIIVGVPGDMCDDCMDADCDPDGESECRSEHSYENWEEENPYGN